MAKRKQKIALFVTAPQFDPSIDTPLRHFSTKETFVRSTRRDNYKLYCEHYMVLMIDYDGFIYSFPSYQPHYEPYVEAFIHEYAPHISLAQVKPYLGKLHYDYIGKPLPVTL